MAKDGRRTRFDGNGNANSWLTKVRNRLGLAALSRTVLWTVALICGLCTTGVAVASAVGSPATHSRPQVVTAAPRLPQGAHAVGAVSPASQVSGVVALKLRSEAAVQRFIASVSNRRSSNYHQYLAPGQFGRRFGPTRASIAAVEAKLKAGGLQVSSVSANGLLVHFSGTAAHVEATFGTGLERVRLANGTYGRATTSAVKLPSSVASQVTSVVGLNQTVHFSSGVLRDTKRHPAIPSATQPRTTGGGPTACPDAQALGSEYGALTDQQVATSYGLDSLYSAGDLGSGQTVDIFELEPFSTSDVQTFDECYFGKDNTSNITVHNVDGGPGTGPGSGEAALDVEDVSGFAPQAKIHVFQGPNTTDGSIDVYNDIATVDDARQISTSWGFCEANLQQAYPGEQQVENEIFQQTAAQGQSVYSAAGDDGSDDCANHGSSPVAPNLSVDDPGSQPYVTSVGGTTITKATQPPSESVWNNGSVGGAGGGGISESWGMPSWQSDLAVPQTSADEACSNDPSGTADNYHLAGFDTTLPAGTPCREVPDVSALADPQSGITIYQGGEWFPIGGTSSSAPIWAAITAEMNASSYCNATELGFISPLLYQVAASSPSNYAHAFNDITSGSNDNLSVGSGSDFTAGTGYDMASGLGTPRVTNTDGSPGLAEQLCGAAANTSVTRPQITGLSSGRGPISGGGTTTISGSHFGSSPGSVYFGTVPATVDSWSDSSITVNVPAYGAPAGTPAGSAGRAIVTVVTPGVQSSSPSGNDLYDYTTDSTGKPVVDLVSNVSGPSAGGPNGPTAGGNEVELIGSGFTGATSVMFGSASATIDRVVGDNRLLVTVPAQSGSCAVPASQGVCSVAVTVTTPKGTSSGPSILPAYQGPIVFGANGVFAPPAGCGCEVAPQPEEYDYANAPHITSVSPAYVDETATNPDASTATVTGSGFNILTYEWTNIGPAGPAANQDFNLVGISGSTVSVSVPPVNPTTEADPMPISVMGAGQLSNVSQIVYAGVPTVSSISTHLVSQADPGYLTITGSGLSDVDMIVFPDQIGFGTYSQTSEITNQTDSQLTVKLPSMFATPTDVLACTVTGCSNPDPSVDTLTFAYPGQPEIDSISPSTGPANGGTTVEINGKLDSEVTSVMFGSKPATIVSQPIFTPSGQIVVTAPQGTPGQKVNITISTEGGQLVGAPTSNVTPAAVFTYGPYKPTGNFTLGAPTISKKGVLTFKITAPAKGTFTGKGGTTVPHTKTLPAHKITYGQATATASKAGPVTLVIKPTKAARTALTKGDKLRVRVVVTFKPPFGNTVTHSRTVTVKGQK